MGGGRAVVMLSAGQPDWVVGLGAVAGDVCDQLGVAVAGSRGWYVRPDLRQERLLASCNRAPGEPRAVVLAAAGALAGLWGGWLDEVGVGCTVWLPGVSATVSGGQMRALWAGEITGAEWWMAAEHVIG